MKNLREIRKHISSVKEMEQITRAMKMVASAKLRLAQNKLNHSRDYGKELYALTNELLKHQQINDGDIPYSTAPKNGENTIFVVVGSDRGLCGGFNNNLFKYIISHIQENNKKLKAEYLKMVLIGRKSCAYFERYDYETIQSYPDFFDNFNYNTCKNITQELLQQFNSGKVKEVYIAYNEFKTVMNQKPMIQKILPIDIEKIGMKTNDPDIREHIIEPNVDIILDYLIPQLVYYHALQATLESNAAEQSARMVAMDNATENAKELQRTLRIDYNRARQTAITTEITEIVSGAEVLKKG